MMIGVDTNVLVRFLVQDDPKQARIANLFFENADAQGLEVWISLICLCELAWVLESCYKMDKKALCNVLTMLFQVQQIRIEDEAVAQDALTIYQNTTRVDFSDCLIGLHNTSHRCVHTVTFDKQAAHLSAFSLLV